MPSWLCSRLHMMQTKVKWSTLQRWRALLLVLWRELWPFISRLRKVAGTSLRYLINLVSQQFLFIASNTNSNRLWSPACFSMLQRYYINWGNVSYYFTQLRVFIVWSGPLQLCRNSPPSVHCSTWLYQQFTSTSMCSSTIFKLNTKFLFTCTGVLAKTLTLDGILPTFFWIIECLLISFM